MSAARPDGEGPPPGSPPGSRPGPPPGPSPGPPPGVLPGLPPECVKLASDLRELRTATGLSLAGLAAKTPYSKSSWERYLNGKVLPPRQAVETLCALAGERRDRTVALWRLADDAVSRRGAAGPAVSGTAGTAAGQTAPSTPAPPPAIRRRRLPVLVAAAVCVLGGLTAGVAFVAGDRGGDRVGDQRARSAVEGRGTVAGPACHGATCTGTNPESARCSSAAAPPVTVAERDFGGVIVKVRRSAVCDTVWARLDRGTEGDRVEIAVGDGEPQRAEVHDRFDAMASVSTPMVAVDGSALRRVRVCLVRGGDRDCVVLKASGASDASGRG
ncbi:helix-turn-helix domain-containing protein [Streptomyces sp. NPDC058953]|uniref:helix-turn-helix domain-containing protein n=1 Tax=unclassified Streptomyces TaxID=2593676 RepID=UPI0036A97299